MNPNRDTHALAEFQRDTAEFLRTLTATGRPLVLTVDGKAELVVQDVRSYQRLLDLEERLETIEAVRDGLASIDRGEGRSMDEPFDDLETMPRVRAQP